MIPREQRQSTRRALDATAALSSLGHRLSAGHTFGSFHKGPPSPARARPLSALYASISKKADHPHVVNGRRRASRQPAPSRSNPRLRSVHSRHEPEGHLVVEVRPLGPYVRVRRLHLPHGLVSPATAPLPARDLSLGNPQPPGGRAAKAGVGDLSPVRQRRKRRESNVDPDRRLDRGQGRCHVLDRKAAKYFPASRRIVTVLIVPSRGR